MESEKCLEAYFKKEQPKCMASPRCQNNIRLCFNDMNCREDVKMCLMDEEFCEMKAKPAAKKASKHVTRCPSGTYGVFH